MKSLIQLMEVSDEELPKIYCDLDEVLVDFLAGADKAVGGKFATHDKDDRWNKINQTKGFWSGLNWKPGGKRLYQFISRYDPNVLSAHSGRDPTSKVGKSKWLAKNTKFPRSNINLVKRHQKKNFATIGGNPNILIDDYIKNIKEWKSAGGIGIHHTNVNKTLAELKKLGFK